MNEVGWSILLLVILAPASLFFTLNNLAVRSFSRVRLQEAFERLGREQQFERFVRQEEAFTVATGSLRLLCNVGIIFIVAFLFARHHFLLAFAVAAAILEIFSLIIPHAWAKHAGEAILPYMYPVLLACSILLKPVLYVYQWHDRLVRRLAGVQAATPELEQEERQEEILNLVEQGKMEGYVAEEELEMIENVLELRDTTAEEIMTPRTDIIAIEVEDDLQTVLETVRDKGYSRIPVYEGTVDHIVGLIYAKDLLTEIGHDPSTFHLRDKLRPVYYVPETKLLRNLLHEFQAQKLHISVVLDEYGGTAGIVTIEDILEELVGEIADEYEQAPQEMFRKIDEQTFEVDARMYIDDANSEMEIELPEEEDYDTLGGFVFSHLGYIPKVGERFDYNDLHITITAAGPRAVKRLRIRKKTAQKKESQS
ncbi:MAG: hemolysin family protein [Planctomycetaceae bacterium]|nr:hemolysin family protein [Planctomycetaceae bacterium]